MNKAAQLVEKSKTTELISVPDLIQNSIPELAKMLNDEKAATRFARIVTTSCRVNPDLLECTPLSFMGALFTAAELKLEPVAGHAYLIPFWNSRKVGDGWKKIREVQLVLGYKGIADLFYRHAKAISLSWGVVHKNDEFEFEKGTDSFLKHRRALSERGEKIAYWVMAKMSGGCEFEVMSYEECIIHGEKHSKTFDKKSGEFYKSSPWVTSEDSMCLKTVLKQLSKTLPLSVEIQKAIQADETTRYVNPVDVQSGKVGTVIDLPDQTNWDAPEEPKQLEEGKENEQTN